MKFGKGWRCYSTPSTKCGLCSHSVTLLTFTATTAAKTRPLDCIVPKVWSRASLHAPCLERLLSYYYSIPNKSIRQINNPKCNSDSSTHLSYGMTRSVNTRSRVVMTGQKNSFLPSHHLGAMLNGQNRKIKRRRKGGDGTRVSVVLTLIWKRHVSSSSFIF